ncbi:MAG: tRNA (guanosine(37)-N1)-methyltransferase TrmD [Candidatus Paceibacterota bacterium]|jgi:tRNA (guanine37-N1)-methyltransferase
MVNFHIITLFPEALGGYLNSSMLWRAQKEKKIKIYLHNPRNYSLDKHKKVDGRPYGGGPGMVMSVEPLLRNIKAIEKKYLKAKSDKLKALVIITSPAGKVFDNKLAKTMSVKYNNVIIVCGHYEGIDARLKKILKAGKFKVEDVSIGPYVLTGGELPALVMADAISRQIEGVLGNDESLEEKRVSSSETYTRPEVYTHNKKKYKVPKVLLSGHHKEIEKWKEMRIKRGTNADETQTDADKTRKITT